MRLSAKYLRLMIIFLLCGGGHVSAQEVESAPQEPPYVQDSEFDSAPSQLSDEDLAIEAEMQQSLDPVAQPRPQDPVNLNEFVGDAPVAPELNEEDTALDFEISEDPVVPVYATPTPKVSEPAKPKGAVGSKAGRVQYIEHPQAAKGLLRITEDGSYVYRTEDLKAQGRSGTFRVGMMDPPKIVSADGMTTYESMYSGSSQPLLMFDYEWQPFSGFGKLGVQGGLGFLMATGKGRFVSGSMAGEEAKESYTFVAVPLNLGLVYRMELARRQWLAPYISAGGSYVGIVEFRDDDKGPSAVGTPGAYGAGGLMFNISALDRSTAFAMANEYGIANMWVTLEYRYLYTFSEDVDLTSGIISAGVSVDY